MWTATLDPPFLLDGKKQTYSWRYSGVRNKLNDNIQNSSEEYVTLFVYVMDVPMGAEIGLEIQRAS